jgi:hypothetical protein
MDAEMHSLLKDHYRVSHAATLTGIESVHKRDFAGVLRSLDCGAIKVALCTECAKTGDKQLLLSIFNRRILGDESNESLTAESGEVPAAMTAFAAAQYGNDDLAAWCCELTNCWNIVAQNAVNRRDRKVADFLIARSGEKIARRTFKELLKI